MQIIIKFLKKTGLAWLTLGIIVIATACFFANNGQMYREPLGKITTISTQSTGKQSDQYGNRVKTYNQKLTVQRLNGQHRGETIHLNNSFDSAEALNVRLHKGQQVFLTHDGHANWSIKNVRHDYIWIPFAIFVLGSLWILMGQHGRIMILTLFMNVGLFIAFVWLNNAIPNQNLFVLFIPFAIIVTILTLGLLMGFRSKQMWVISSTVLLTSLITLGLSEIVFQVLHNQGVYYEHMDFVTENPDNLFMAMTLVGVLGAVMDEATDMTATLFSLKRERPSISTSELIHAGRDLGGEIFGALNNVLFLIFIAEQLPMAVLYLRNGNTWSFTYISNLSIGMIQTLISAIGIVLTVPVGLLVFKLFDRSSHQKIGGQG
ncbi:putative membrane protein [Weissella uvarum]|uniref:YibE/F family protein n=1 Tax=Weissella uvarum TaxID=1479233 RepID=UPI001960E184|nr:YibE/F family protein [Weissella uvarum]MBM7617473.1 putative membrane protein [Weissella uvarum]MCM0595642.1 YibE/F family protein [Weissella uvarum]